MKEKISLKKSYYHAFSLNNKISVIVTYIFSYSYQFFIIFFYYIFL